MPPMTKNPRRWTLDELKRDAPATLDVHDVAATLGITNDRVYAMAARGVLPEVRLGPRSVRYATHHLIALLEHGRVA